MRKIKAIYRDPKETGEEVGQEVPAEEAQTGEAAPVEAGEATDTAQV